MTLATPDPPSVPDADPKAEPTRTGPDLRTRFRAGVDRPVLGFVILIHAVPLALCLFFFSWAGLGLLGALYLLTGLGVTVGYHRKLTHQSFKSPVWVDHLLAVLGLLSGEGPPIFWVAHHRKHHRFSDAEGDPHSPREGLLWAHMLWLLPRQNKLKLAALYKKWAPDLVRNPFYASLETTYLYWHGGLLLALLAAGWIFGGWTLAVSFVAYGFFLRTLLVLHATWMVNSLSHRWGYQSYATKDESRNNALVGLLAHGEGWHNNHHHCQASVNHGHHWWEFDFSFLAILFVALLSWPLAWVGWSRHRPVYDLNYFDHRKRRIRILFRE